MGDLSHLEIEELLGAYALDAVEPEEARAVASHLAYCPRCRAEVASHQEVASLMAEGGAPAPERLWSRITARLEEQPPELDLALITPPSRRPARWPRAVAAVAAAAVISGLGLVAIRQEERIDDLKAAVGRRSLDTAASGALADRAALRVDLRSEDGRTFVHAVVQTDGTGFVVDHNLPPLPSHRTYQLWAKVGEAMVSVGVLGSEPGLAAFKVDRDPAVLAITAEPAGGVVAPSLPPLVLASVPVADGRGA